MVPLQLDLVVFDGAATGQFALEVARERFDVGIAVEPSDDGDRFPVPSSVDTNRQNLLGPLEICVDAEVLREARDATEVVFCHD